MDTTDWIAFVEERLPWARVTQADIISASAGGMSGEIVRVHLAPRSDSLAPSPFPPQVIVKCTKIGKEKFETDLGTTREADFYAWGVHNLPRAVQPALAHVYYARDEATALTSESGASLHRKVLILEDLSLRHGVQAGYFFGPYSLHNWGKDLDALTSRFSANVTGRDVTLRAFELSGHLHARFWRDEALLAGPEARFLRAAQWLRGEGEAAFHATVQAAVGAWESFKASQAAEPTVTLDERIRSLIDKTCAETDFARYVAQWKEEVPWTLVHGDYHPANMMVVDCQPSVHDSAKDVPVMLHGASHFDLILLDWEVVGVGSGPQDLGQFVISHTSQAARRAIEADALKAYQDALRAGGLAEDRIPSLEFIRGEYVRGGLARWCWLFPLCAVACPPKATQFFHDQMLEFMEDHPAESATITMMRP